MYRKNNKTKLFISIILIVLLLIGIGVARVTSSLNINGVTDVAGNTWDIHFNNIQVTEGSVPINSGGQAATIDSNNNTLITYSIVLPRPRKFYEFTVDVVNAGTIDGMINLISNQTYASDGITQITKPDYIIYTITYSDGEAIEKNHILRANTSETYKVRVEYNDESASIIPSQTENIIYKFQVNFIQANENAKEVNHKLNGTKYATNRYIEEGYVYIDRPVPEEMRLFDTPSEAKADYFNNPFYLKYIIEEDIVKESYVCFEIENNSYCLRGEYITNFDENTQSQVCRIDVYPDCTNPYFEDNVAIMLEAFGNSYCTHYENSTICTKEGLQVESYKDGNLATVMGNYSCGINPDSGSDCSTL